MSKKKTAATTTTTKPASVPAKSENEKTLRGTVTLFRNALSGSHVYLRGKKIFNRITYHGDTTTRELDTVEAGYLIRREYAMLREGLSKDLIKKYVTIDARLAKCKWGAEASLKLDKMLGGARK